MKWKRIIGWTAGIIFGLLILSVITGLLVLRSQGFHRYVLGTIVKQGNEATGGKVEVGNFDFSFSTLTAHLYDFTIHGTEPSGDKPLLHVDRLTVGLKILSVLRREVNLRDLEIEHPAVHLIVDKNGRNNIPEPNAPKDKSSSTNVFDLAVGHVLIADGEIIYNNRKVPVDADITDLRAETHFDSLATRYVGSISYRNGRVHYSTLAHFSHGVDAQFTATPSDLNLSSLVLTVGSSRISLQAAVSDYNNPKVSGNYNILVHTLDVAALSGGGAVAGDFSMSGRLSYQGMPNHPLLRDVVLDGQVSSETLRVTSPQGRVELRKLNGGYQLANANLRISDFAVDLLSGQVNADLSVQNLDSFSSSRLHASLRGISLQAAKTALKSISATAVPLIGTVSGNAEASWTGGGKNLLVRSDLDIRGSATSSIASPTDIPVSGAVHASYDGARNVLTVRQSTIRTPATSLIADGKIGDRSNLGIHLTTGNLHELTILASMVQSSNRDAKASPPLELSGSGNFDAVVSGSLRQPVINAQVKAQNLGVDGCEWRTLAFHAQASSSGISIENGSLISTGPGQVSFSGRAGLRSWSYFASDPIELSASVMQMPAAQIEQLARLQYPVQGNISADITLRGTQLDPTGSASLHLTQGRIADEPVQNLNLRFQAASGTVNSSLDVKLQAGSATATLAFTPKTKGYRFQLNAPGIILSRLQTVQAKNLPLNGTLTASASGEGTLDSPNLTATLQIPQFQFQHNSFTGIKAELKVANQRADLVLSSGFAQSTFRAHATVNLVGAYYADATIDSSKIPLEPLLAIFVRNRPTGFQGETELHATLKGPLKNRAGIEAHVVIPTLTASYQSLQIANSSPIRFDYANSIVVIHPSEIKGTDTSLQFQGRIPVDGIQPVNVTAKGSVDLRILQIVSSDIKSSGMIDLDVNTQGTSSHPIVKGQVQLKNASLSNPSAPVGLSHANGVFDVGTEQVRIAQFSGQVGGGQISAGGTITYRPQIQFNTALQAKSVRLLYPEGLRTVLDGDVNLTGTTNDATLGGRVLVNSLSFTADFDLANFLSQFTGTSVPPAEETFADRVKLNVSVQSADQLSATSSEVSIEGQANLRVIGTASDPVVIGRADLNSGDAFFLSNRYQIQRGVITFNNPNETSPTVNLAVSTSIQQYNLTINVSGPIDKLQTSYVSDPPLSTVDIINLIARGQTTEQADTTNLSANSLLAQGVASRLSSGVQKLAGLSSLSIDPLLSGNNGNPSARIALQQRVTKNFFFTFSTDVTQPQSEIVEGDYQLNKRWSVSAARNASGGISVDGKFHTNF
jgi:translocation and assembly module TamB